jgi:hypothetical protein
MKVIQIGLLVGICYLVVQAVLTMHVFFGG